MMKENILMKNAMNYGAIAGLILVFYNLVLYFSGSLFSNALGYVGYGILLAIIVMATKKFRDRDLEGVIGFKKALGFGVLIGFFASIIMGFYHYLLYEFIDPGLLRDSYAVMEDRMLESGNMDEDEIIRFMDVAKENTSTLSIALFTIPAFTFWGFILSLPAALILKKEDNPFRDKNQ